MICVDGSVAVKWVLNEERSYQARTLYEAALRAAEPIVAPTLLPLEVTNILRQRMRANDGLSLTEAVRQLGDFLDFASNSTTPWDRTFRRLPSPTPSTWRRHTMPTTWRWPSISVASSGRTTSD